MRFEKEYIKGKFPVIVTIVIVVCVAIFAAMLKTMTVDREKWVELRQTNFERDNVITPPERGNILSTSGELMASSLPNYKIHFDYLAGVPVLKHDAEGRPLYKAKDSLLRDSLLAGRLAFIERNIPAMSSGLARICPGAGDSARYDRHLREGLKQRARYFDVCEGYILNYIQYNQLRRLPVFDIKSKNRSGVVADERNNRKKPFGSLASRILGKMYGAKDSAIYGLELAYDSLLRGENGLSRQRRVRSKTIEIIDKEPVPGYDLVSTIDVSLQDACESALRDQLLAVDAEFGLVILMETKTGDVKAIVNLGRDTTDRYNYYENQNYAMEAAMEPGSTFKTASIMVALDDGLLKVTDQVDVASGVYVMYGCKMRDAGWYRSGGIGLSDVTRIMIKSSNVGVSRLIDERYHSDPYKFINGLRRVGIAAPLGIPLRGVRDPVVQGPNENRRWTGASLPWMSVGYNSMIPPINTVTFYNAIANNGRMVRPRFARGISRDGRMVREFPVEVIKEQICKPTTLAQVREILRQVVNDPGGTGKRARNRNFSVSGKTGTAQVVYKGTYATGMHFTSFCGFFPSDDPQYTCLVSIQSQAGGAGGGTWCAPVFAKISERVYQRVITANIASARDSDAILVPDVKRGDGAAARRVLRDIGVSERAVDIREAAACDSRHLPDLTGMGARDAVYAVESRGMRAVVRGVGRVHLQSVAAGSVVRKGRTVVLELH